MGAFDEGRAVAMSGDPAVSIVIPAHNHIDYCRRCIDSIRECTHYPYRLILVDNGSTDGVSEYFDSIPDTKTKGVRRLEYWSQEWRAPRYHLRHGMKEIGRHYRFRMKPTPEISDMMSKAFIGIEYLYCACMPEEWPLIKEKYEVLAKHPLEPHLCGGYEIRF